MEHSMAQRHILLPRSSHWFLFNRPRGQTSAWIMLSPLRSSRVSKWVKTGIGSKHCVLYTPYLCVKHWSNKRENSWLICTSGLPGLKAFRRVTTIKDLCPHHNALPSSWRCCRALRTFRNLPWSSQNTTLEYSGQRSRKRMPLSRMYRLWYSDRTQIGW